MLTRVPAIIVDGDANALSAARSLAARGVPVHAIGSRTAPLRRSRHLRSWLGSDDVADWLDGLLSAGSRLPPGSVLIPCGDRAIRMLVEHREALGSRYRIDVGNPTAQLQMLNKHDTAEIAARAGVPAPAHWYPRDETDLVSLADELRFPLIVKPHLTYLLVERVGRKFLDASDIGEATAAWRTLESHGIEAFLLERIPGPDAAACSYYTYLDEHGDALFHFTKRIIRRNPPGEGLACFHVTDHVPDVQELALRFLRAAGLQGLAAVEFKLDHRDGTLKLIECNARLTAATPLVTLAGLDLPCFLYERMTTGVAPVLNGFRDRLYLWHPARDVRAFSALRRRGELSLRGWIGSMPRRFVLPYWAWDDPGPSFTLAIDSVRGAARSRLWSRVRGSSR